MVANRVPVLRARRLTQTFLSRPYAPATVQALLPEGLVVDEFENAAWVTLTPLLMADVRPAALFSRSVDHAWAGATRPVRSPYPSNPRQGGRT
ncbi:hypothetical protein GT030_31555 [Streptomyces sp. SID1328]|uniref:DUF2071 domain-containing protein n=1 Tax=Streptomyces sp. SID1328 TaxID=2690250 RepID=UPI0013701ED8|nr:DUF2071 domain-containing protein [Streptomyces sp. SID1328]MYV43266.1 hypothetical protein [Streptomyces sp. SID1328]